MGRPRGAFASVGRGSVGAGSQSVAALRRFAKERDGDRVSAVLRAGLGRRQESYLVLLALFWPAEGQIVVLIGLARVVEGPNLVREERNLRERRKHERRGR